LTLEPANEELKNAERMIVSGNQAVCLGALAAGCKFVGGYPITPATSILEFMMKHLFSLDGVVIQYEDEIASLSGCLGASWGPAERTGHGDADQDRAVRPVICPSFVDG